MSGLYVVLTVGLIVALSAGFNQFRKKVGTSYVARKLTQLDTSVYHVVSNVALDDQSEKVDHVVLSVYGAFVIDQENYNGSIYGKESDEMWIYQVKKRQKTFNNPIKQTEAVAKQLAAQLEMDEKHFHPLVAFSNSAILAVEDELIKKSLVMNYDQLPETIKTWKTPQLSKQKVADILEKLN